MRQKIILLFLALGLVIGLVACGAEAKGNTGEIRHVCSDKSIDIYIWTDQETGNDYIIYDGYECGGIIPREH